MAPSGAMAAPGPPARRASAGACKITILAEAVKANVTVSG
jgi:hypothetical protein